MKFTNAENWREDLFNRWPQDWPDKSKHVIPHDVTVAQYEELVALLDAKAGEREIEMFLTRNREALSMVIWLFSTGHHMSWIFPKAPFRPSVGEVGGLIPDYLVAGANSMGVQYFVLELKGPDKRAFVKQGKRVYLSAEANKGVCQLMNYLDYAARDQAYLRDSLQLHQFREPTGVLLIGTDEETEDPQVRQFKAAWNRMNPQIMIRSYSALQRTMLSKLQDHRKLPTVEK
ncbi:Shedu anti-phage system protein SduA domain-containing protein [Cohaesibacter gelatinilyticus]|uniref:Shedu protein SduA C-terminal domain-containing protein n=1 Tax=Cohaesibacter gelatinilyticus TaxID=372072 RepID=A0A285PI17_9HYPH|nr:Shedu anti-phage system protein SduA domain-containing protein [Cohaesibacter gelatinilyticus]SNZ19511.1 protein of unknown function [Cohaesibacter gelatinilyticus]